MADELFDQQRLGRLLALRDYLRVGDYYLFEVVERISFDVVAIAYFADRYLH